jgi:hypothetical protein
VVPSPVLVRELEQLHIQYTCINTYVRTYLQIRYC